MDMMYSTLRMSFYKHRDVFKMVPLVASHNVEMCALRQQRYEEIGLCLKGTLFRGVDHPHVYLLIPEYINKHVPSDRYTGEWIIPADGHTQLRCPVCGQTDSGFFGKAIADVKYTAAAEIDYPPGGVSADYSRPLHCVRCDYEAHVSKFEMGNWHPIPTLTWQAMLDNANR